MTADRNSATSRFCVTRSPSGSRSRASQVTPSNSAGLHRVPEPVLLGVSVDRPGDEVYRIRETQCLLAVHQRTNVGELNGAFVFEES